MELLAPVPEPPTIRDFFSFYEHARKAMSRRGREIPEVWYSSPVFYFSNPAVIVSPDVGVVFPKGCEKRDFECELAAVIGTAGEVVGFTIMNDWSARDIQRREMEVGLGPSKGKDFATSLGPWVMSRDEFESEQREMWVLVNGEERARGSCNELYHSWDAMLLHASRDSVVRAGDILGSGTMRDGCILDIGDERWLQHGDRVEISVQGLGTLRNFVLSQHEADGSVAVAELGGRDG